MKSIFILSIVVWSMFLCSVFLWRTESYKYKDMQSIKEIADAAYSMAGRNECKITHYEMYFKAGK